MTSVTVMHREAVFTMCSVICLIPHAVEDEAFEAECRDATTTVEFKDRVWSMGSVVSDTLLKKWIRILKKKKVEKGMARIRETNTTCVHQRASGCWCF